MSCKTNHFGTKILVRVCYKLKADFMCFTGPSHWGRASMMFSDDIWSACAKGHLQSPINIRLDDLIFDHTLKPLFIDGIASKVRLRCNCLKNQKTSYHCKLMNFCKPNAFHDKNSSLWGYAG